MRERINKPRVFLSHSRYDIEFIERIESDLRRCQIEPWRDQNEIRDGQPWQQVIFGEGLPTCDVIITYYTENSTASQMVSKEVDATLLRQLADNGISFLPYVNNEQTRRNLRIDIQSLQCRVWNNENYNQILPTVVAEIWRSYMERNIAVAILSERNRRLELELELKNLKTSSESSTFTPQENKEFEYFYNELNKPLDVIFDVDLLIKDESGKQIKSIDLGTDIYKTSIVYLVIWFINGENDTFSDRNLSTNIHHYLDKKGINYPRRDNENEIFRNPKFSKNISLQLKTFGLVEIKSNLSSIGSYSTSLFFSAKMYRFKFWLEYNNLDKLPSFEFVEFIEKEELKSPSN